MAGKPVARDLIREVKREFKRVKKELEPEMLADAAKPRRGHLANEEFRNIIVAQNVLRPCMEAMVDCLLPFSHVTALELATRLASYALSIAPYQDQAKMVELFLQGFANAHEMRLALEIVIKTDWETKDGNVVPNDNHPLAHTKGKA